MKSLKEDASAKMDIVSEKVTDAIDVAKEAGASLACKAKHAGQSVVESVKGAGQAIADTACSAGHKISETAQGAVEGLRTAKDFVVEKASNPGETIEEVKAWGTEKAQQGEGLLDRLQLVLAQVSESLTQVRTWAADKADRVDHTLELSQGVLTNAEQTLAQAHDWAREKTVKVGDVLDKSREAIEQSTEQLVARTEELRVISQEALERAKHSDCKVQEERAAIGLLASETIARIERAPNQSLAPDTEEVRASIVRARASIKTLERKLLQLGVDPDETGVQGTSSPDAEILRDNLLEEKKHLSDFEDTLRGSAGGLDGPLIRAEKI